jgi:hypothetical protein
LGKENDLCQRRDLANLASSVKTIDPWQSNVEKNDVGRQCLCFLDGFWSVVSCTDNLKVGMEIENGANVATKGGVVFHHEDANPVIGRLCLQ